MFDWIWDYGATGAAFILAAIAALFAVSYFFRVISKWCADNVVLFGPPPSGRRHPIYGMVTIPTGERWSVTQASGVVETVIGPTTRFVFGSIMTQLRCVIASETQYIRTLFIDGHTELTTGPAALWEDKVVHSAVATLNATALTNHEAVVVYRELEDGSAKTVKRSLVRGPKLYVPESASEWLHKFCWHGHDPSGGDLARKRPGGLRFEQLRTCPDQTYYDVENVRTKDDALLTIRLMIFYSIADIEKMLDSTVDPIADFINAASSDVIEFTSSRSFETFKAATEALNELSTYKSLVSRAETIGYKISKVVFRGYLAQARLQKMHDDSIEKRTRLVLERESEQQEQELADFKLQREHARSALEREQESACAEHQMELERNAFEQRLQLEAKESQQKLETEEKTRLSELRDVHGMQTTLGLTPEKIASILICRAQGTPAKLVQIQGNTPVTVHEHSE